MSVRWDKVGEHSRPKKGWNEEGLKLYDPLLHSEKHRVQQDQRKEWWIGDSDRDEDRERSRSQTFKYFMQSKVAFMSFKFVIIACVYHLSFLLKN